MKGDPGEGDKVHEWLEGEEGDVGGHQKAAERRQAGGWVKDEERRPRTKEEMDAEAKWLREEMAKDEQGGDRL